MSRAPSMPLFTDAYLGDTMHLSVEEHGAYLKLLMIHWRLLPKHPPDDDRRLARMLGVSQARWRKLKPVVCDDVLYRIEAGELRQKRLEKEFRYVAERGLIARQNGAKGGRPKAPSANTIANPAGDPAGLSRENPTPSPQAQPQAQDSGLKRPGGEPPSIAQRLWSDEPGGCLHYLQAAGVAQARSLLGRWRSQAVGLLGPNEGEAAVLAAVLAAERAAASAPQAYVAKLLAGRFDAARHAAASHAAVRESARLRPPSPAEAEAWARGGAVPRLVTDDNPWPPGWLEKQERQVKQAAEKARTSKPSSTTKQKVENGS